MYVFANPNPHKLITDDCVVRAIALADGRTWEDVYIDLLVEGYIEKEMPNANLYGVSILLTRVISGIHYQILARCAIP